MDRFAYTYLAGALFSLGLWAGLFRLRADLRRPMIIMSAIAVVIGVPHEYWLWTRDWWHPPTITHTRIGFEDVAYAIGTGGALAATFPTLFRQRMEPGRAPARGYAAMPLAILFLVPIVLVEFARMHSFVACSLGAGAAVAWILVARPDLIRVAALNIVLGMSMSFACFWLLNALTPGFVAAMWDLSKLSGVLFSGVPVEDLAWYAQTAAMFGTYYAYASGARFVPQTQPAATRAEHSPTRLPT